MADEKPQARFRYLQMSEGEQHHVFLVHDDTPGWYRLIATFPIKQRAIDYAEFEDEMASDWRFADHGYSEGEEPAPATLPDAPKSSIGPELLGHVRNTPPVVYIGIGKSEVVAQPAPQPGERQLVPESVPIDLPKPTHPLQEPAAGIVVPAPSPTDGASGVRLDPAVDAAVIFHLLSGKSVRRVAKITGVNKDTVQTRRAFLVETGKLTSRSDAAAEREEEDAKFVQAEDTAEESAGQSGLSSRESKILWAVKALHARGKIATAKTIAEESDIPSGSVYWYAGNLVAKKLLGKDARGDWVPFGAVPVYVPPAPNPLWEKLAVAKINGVSHPIAADVPPLAASKDAAEEALIAKHLADKRKGWITIDDIIAELKETGHGLTHNDARDSFKLDGATKKLTRDELFALANRTRLANGRPMWDARKVEWA